MRLFFVLLVLLGSAPAHAEQILGAAYDPARDAIVLEIAYRGTDAHHRFTVEWGRCDENRPPHVAGRVIDLQWEDAAQNDYRVRAHLGLQALPCRPAVVTLRLYRTSHVTLFVPEPG